MYRNTLLFIFFLIFSSYPVKLHASDGFTNDTINELNYNAGMIPDTAYLKNVQTYKYSGPSYEQSFFQWLLWKISSFFDRSKISGKIFSIVFMMVILAGMTYIILLLSGFRFRKAGYAPVTTGTQFEEISEMPEENILAMVQKLLGEENYKEAFRFKFIYLLKRLNEFGVIKLSAEKTNSEYQDEINNQNIKSIFSFLNNQFNLRIYGDFKMGLELFTEIDEQIDIILKKADEDKRA